MGASRPGSQSYSLSNFLGGKSNDPNYFSAAAVAGRYGNGGARKLQKICEEFDAGLICAAFDWRGGKREFDRVAKLTGDGVLSGTRVHFDGEGCTRWSVVDGDHKKAITTEDTEEHRELKHE